MAEPRKKSFCAPATLNAEKPVCRVGAPSKKKKTVPVRARPVIVSPPLSTIDVRGNSLSSDDDDENENTENRSFLKMLAAIKAERHDGAVIDVTTESESPPAKHPALTENDVSGADDSGDNDSAAVASDADGGIKKRVRYSVKHDCLLLHEILGDEGLFSSTAKKGDCWEGFATRMGKLGLDVNGQGLRKHFMEVRKKHKKTANIERSMSGQEPYKPGTERELQNLMAQYEQQVADAQHERAKAKKKSALTKRERENLTGGEAIRAMAVQAQAGKSNGDSDDEEKPVSRSSAVKFMETISANMGRQQKEKTTHELAHQKRVLEFKQRVFDEEVSVKRQRIEAEERMQLRNEEFQRQQLQIQLQFQQQMMQMAAQTAQAIAQALAGKRNN